MDKEEFFGKKPEDGVEVKSKLMKRIFRLMHMMHRVGPRGHGEFGGSAHRGQGRVLTILKMKPEMSQKELSYLLDIRNQSLGELILKLEKAGYIVREPSQDDKRIMMVRLTDEGRAAAEKAESRDNIADRIFKTFSEEEMSQMLVLFDKLLGALEDEFETENNMYDEFTPNARDIKDRLEKMWKKGQHHIKNFFEEPVNFDEEDN